MIVDVVLVLSHGAINGGAGELAITVIGECIGAAFDDIAGGIVGKTIF